MALAQTVPAGNASEDQPSPSNQARPDSAKLNAAVAVAFGFDDNIFVTKNDKVDDSFVLLEPSVSYSLVSPRRSLKLHASGEVAFHDRNPGENYDDWAIGGDGQLKLAGQTQVLAGGSYQWEHESRTSPEDIVGSAPTFYRRAYGYAGLVGRNGHLAYRLGATLSDFNYSDTPAGSGIINNADRDRIQTELGGRIGYAISRGPELFVQGQWDKRHYRRAFDDAGLHRSSEGFSLSGGLRHKFAEGLSGEIFAGILHQDYSDPALKDVHTIDYGLLLDWTGARNVAGSFRLDRSVEETTMPGASAYVLTSGTFSIEVPAGSRLTVGGSLTGSDYDFRGVPRSEFVVDAGLWSRYWLSERIYVGAGYTFSQRVSNAAGFDYNQNRIMMRLGAQLRPHFEAGGRKGAALDNTGEGSLDGGYFAVQLGHGALTSGLDGPRGTGSNVADFGDVDFDFSAALPATAGSRRRAR